MNNYKEILTNNIVIVPMREAHAEQLEALQRIVFPSLAEEELLHADQYRAHIQLFPEGQFVALDGEAVIGATSSIRYHFDINKNEHHSFFEIMGGGWFTTHEPAGEWLYGMDVSVHPRFRGLGIARALYRARQYTCRQLGLKGQMTVGMLNGYCNVKDKVTIEDYFDMVKTHKVFDPTVSVQEKIGFSIVSLMKDYLNDETCGNAGAVIVLDAGIDI